MSAPISLSKHDLMGSVIENAGICAGEVPADELQLWKELAAYLSIGIRGKDLLRIVKAVLVELEAEWDDDFVDDDGGLTPALYETLDERVKRYVVGKASGGAEEVEEDDEQGLNRTLVVKQNNWSLSTVFEDIRDRKLILNPEWQRSFVWKAKKQKRLIESILLGLPLPSFLIFTDSASGKRYVIDGRQRLETIAKFKAQKEKKGEQRERFKTFSKSEAGWGPGELLGDAAGKYYDQLPPKHKTKFDTTTLVLSEFIDIAPADLYQVFKRYNTGAVALNAAEIRNAVYQASGLHKMMFRLAGEQGSQAVHPDAAESRISVDLRETMQGKRQRYGTYDFIGRYFAFAYQSGGTVAMATVEFMEQYQNATADVIESLRKEFLLVFAKAQEWYADFLIDPGERRFHAFLGTLQLVSTKLLMNHVDAGRVEEAAMSAAVAAEWPAFVVNRLARKQNSTLFWNSQKTWVSLVEHAVHISQQALTYPTHNWQRDLDPPGTEAEGQP